MKKGKEKIYSFVMCFLYVPHLCLKKCLRKKEYKKEKYQVSRFPRAGLLRSQHLPSPSSCFVPCARRAWKLEMSLGIRCETRFFFGNFHLRREKLPTTGLMMMMTCFQLFMCFILNNTYNCFF